MNVKYLYNGNIITLDKNGLIGTSMLIENGIITDVFDGQSPGNLDAAEKIDLNGKTVIPGFNDNHIHLNFLGNSLVSLHFNGMNENQILDAIGERFKNVKKGEYVYGYDWDYPECVDPRKEMLDHIFPDNPVILSQYGGHCYWVNSYTLNKMNISKNRPDPEAGIVMRDKNNEPTGIIKDIKNNKFLDRWYIKRLINKRENEKNYLASFKELSKYGVTSVHDNTWSFTGMKVLKKLYRERKLSARISCWSYGESPLFRFLFDVQNFKNNWFSKGPVKFFIDGTFTGRTAWLLDPYDDGSNGFGKSKNDLVKLLEKEIKKKNQCAFHAIGDKAVSTFLDALDSLSSKYDNISNLRLRLEHTQLIHPGDFVRIKKLGVIISVQPSAIHNPEKDVKILGRERAERAYPIASLLKYNIPVSFGSDAPGEKTFNPFIGIHNAVNRCDDKKISIIEALYCYSAGSSYAEFSENIKGTLAPGMLADFIIIDKNPLSIDAFELKSIIVEKTFLDGILIYDKDMD